MSVFDKVFVHSIFIILCQFPVVEQTTRKCKQRIGFSICTVALPCIRSKNNWDGEIVDYITRCCHPLKGGLCSLSLNLHDNENDIHITRKGRFFSNTAYGIIFSQLRYSIRL